MANRAHNRISSILNENGELQTSHKNIEVALVQHFRGITKENNLDREQCIKEITKDIPKMVSREDNFNLNKPITKEEVSEVIKYMQNGKAPGPDGFNVDFLKACSNIVKQNILNVAEDSKRSRTILKALNTSFISLIPKQDSALTPDKFRPIALSNVVYKIMSKILASRLKPLLPYLISGEQSSYVKGRQILNNIIQAHEIVHTLTNKRQFGMIMKLDIAKAFSILVNGSPSKIFPPSRGLKQRDPLSPFLFILMMEGLGRSIKEAKFLGKIKGLQLTENAQAMTHQQFVDDTMLQGIPTVKKASAYKQILNDCLGYRNIQRDFLWGKEETRKKWALVSWDKICKPKSHRGLGLNGQEILSNVLGDKLWWRWVKEPEAQWAKTWKEKYASSWQTSDLIRMFGNIKGSCIWNKAPENRSLVQNNSFWEIRARDLALFWEYKWQQEPTLIREDFMSLKQERESQGLIKVKDLWNLPLDSRKWRNWRKIDCREDNPIKIKAEELMSMLKQRKILVTDGQDQLRWGLNKEGTFNIKEAKRIILNLDPCVLAKS
eukprot:PITA_10393